MRIRCQYKWLNKETKEAQCKVCGRIRTLPFDDFALMNHECKPRDGKQPVQVVKQSPPLLKRLQNFSKAAITHAMNKSPTCSQEQINERFKICEGCELFQKTSGGGVCTHESCGCNLNRARVYLNKLGWADQECPIGKWGKVEPETQDDGGV
jgi:hypothetical protein